MYQLYTCIIIILYYVFPILLHDLSVSKLLFAGWVSIAAAQRIMGQNSQNWSACCEMGPCAARHPGYFFNMLNLFYSGIITSMAIWVDLL